MKATKRAPELQLEIEQYYYQEAELLDDHRYGEWLDLFSDDARYWMPTRANRLLREHDKETSVPGGFALLDKKKKLGAGAPNRGSRSPPGPRIHAAAPATWSA